MSKIVKEAWLKFCDVPDTKEEIEQLIHEAIEFQEKLSKEQKSKLQKDYHEYRTNLFKEDKPFQPFYVWLKEYKENYI